MTHLLLAVAVLCWLGGYCHCKYNYSNKINRCIDRTDIYDDNADGRLEVINELLD